jgi:hypothetical protein
MLLKFRMAKMLKPKKSSLINSIKNFFLVGLQKQHLQLHLV